jgi:hypothetical protein
MEQGAAARRGERVRRGFAKDVGFEAGGCDYADVVGEQAQGEVGIDGEEQHIAEFAVVRPFPVTQEVARAGFHLDADELAVRLEGKQVGAAAVGEEHFVNGGPGHIGDRPPGGWQGFGRVMWGRSARSRGRASLQDVPRGSTICGGWGVGAVAG